MAVIDNITTPKFVASGLARTWLDTLLAYRQRRRQYRNTVVQLDSLSDHVLKDIGVSRDNIPDTARVLVYERHR